MKKLIAFIVCLALCASSVLVGAMNIADQAKGAAADSALEGLAAGVTSTPTPSVDAAETPAIVEKETNYWVLTGNVTVSSTDDLADVQTALNAGGTFDGQGFTLTTTINGPMFTALSGGGTIKNLVVAGNITGSSTVEHGIFVQDLTGDGVKFDTVKVVTTTLSPKSSAGFIGKVLAPVSFNNCEFAGKVGVANNTVGGWGGGFIIRVDAAVEVKFTNCTTSGIVNFASHTGGFIGSVQSGTIIIEDCHTSATIDSYTGVKYAEGASGGFVGALSGTGVSATITDSVTEATFVTGGTTKRYSGGMVGAIYHLASDNTDTDAIEGLYVENCTSNCTFSFGESMTADSKLGGFVGSLRNNNSTKSLTFENCVNNTEIKWNNPGVTGIVKYGGFMGSAYPTGNTVITLSSCVNNGNIEVSAKRQNNLAGFIGYVDQRVTTAKTVVRNCINNGNVSLKELEGATANGGFVVGGFLGLSITGMVTDLHNFINNGDISVETTTNATSDVVAGGFFGFLGTASADVAKVYGGANYGAVTAKAGDGATSAIIRAGGCLGFGKFKSLDVDGFFNYGNVSAGCTATAATGSAYAAGITGNTLAGTVTVTNSANIGEVTVSHPATAEAYPINATGSATNCADVSAVADKTFTAVAGEGAAWTTTISKELYDAITANATSVEFGAIITLKAYVNVIGEFTHENFDAYYADNKLAIDNTAGKELGRLYEIAKFDNGQTTLTEAELDGDNYVVNVSLNGAGDYEYVVRTFVKIGDLYIYNN